MWPRKKNKYGAVKVKEDGYTFDSKAEHRRYCELKLLQRAGDISDLAVHPRYPLEVNGERIAIYEADFSYTARTAPRGAVVVEDVKGFATADYRLKAKLFRALYPTVDYRVQAA